MEFILHHQMGSIIEMLLVIFNMDLVFSRGAYVNYTRIWNNTVYNCNAGGILIGAYTNPADYCEVRNNIVYDILCE